MFGSFGSSSRDEAEEAPSSSDTQQYRRHHHQIQHHHQPPVPLPRRGGFPSPAIHMRQLLISCAELISQSDFTSAHRLLTVLSANSTPFGDSTERLVYQFTKALSLRLNRHHAVSNITSSNIYPGGSSATTTTTTALVLPSSTSSNTLIASSSSSTAANVAELDYYYSEAYDEALVQSSYLTANRITPFIRFSQLTANQAILEATEGQPAVHILDFDIKHGFQWPPLMQSIAERFPPPTLRITGTGRDLDTLLKTGERLATFAHSLGLTFWFHPLHLLNDDEDPAASAVLFLPDETLAVNCVLYLHRLLKDRDRLRLFLHRIREMNPRVVTLAEREAYHNHPLFLQRFIEALDHYAAVFDSLEATLPPNSRERLVVERVWFGREIADIVAAEGDDRRERHERFRSWEVMLRSSGFGNVPLSPFALSQAKLLLRLHYPSEGYQLHILNDSFFLGWQNQLLFSVSSWR